MSPFCAVSWAAFLVVLLITLNAGNSKRNRGINPTKIRRKHCVKRHCFYLGISGCFRDSRFFHTKKSF
nr:MAG TPA: hypothetical protein [Caudoviricetes sp.]